MSTIAWLQQFMRYLTTECPESLAQEPANIVTASLVIGSFIAGSANVFTDTVTLAAQLRSSRCGISGCLS